MTLGIFTMTETTASSFATYADFERLNLRVGRILEVQPFPKARNPSWKVRVDLGELGEKWASAQITNYSADELVGSLVVCACNFAPRNIAGFMSEVLILGAPDAQNRVILLSTRKDAQGKDIVAAGAKVF
jgi:tRNA-binding protein